MRTISRLPGRSWRSRGEVDIEGQELSPEDLKLLYSVRTSLQVAAAAQGLRLPAPSCTSTARAACGQHVQAQGADSVCSSLAGTTDHILGITGQQLVLRNLQVNEAKRTNALLTPILEQRLADRTRMLYEWCIDDEMCCEPDADVPKAIEKHMVSKVAAIAASWPANQSAVLNVAKNYKECMDQQVEAWRNLKGIIDHHVHGSEIECYKAQLDCLESQLETTGKLVERCDAELKEVTYTTDSVQALQKVSEVLDAEESTLHARLNQLQVQLQQYQNLGEPMMGVAQEYQKIRGQVEETKHTVDQFNMLLSELDEQKEGMSP
ncbi:unnamed protein product [Ostreobium quekettii]|uniref:Uncharacterized protein n=1 Tax=Ostreobium quekettii TaxID=121088 RepID=A0A8S1IV47_9CHLO|nr:unnamed protein product [Ostreobium quekettii]